MTSPASKQTVDRMPKPKKPILDRLDDLENVVGALRTLGMTIHSRLLITERIMVDKLGVTQEDLDKAATAIAQEPAKAETERQAEKMGVPAGEAKQVGTPETPLYAV